MNNDVLDAAHAIWSQRYSGADVVLAAGSIVRGEATAYSDLDLVVVVTCTIPEVTRIYETTFLTLVDTAIAPALGG